jgi:hypothetical protein
MEKIAWLVLTVVTLVAAIAAQRRPRALMIGRVALGLYYVFAGALVHVVYLAGGETYASFANAAHFSFVRETWRALVAPHYLFFIGLLVVFEATMGILVLSAGRRAEVGMLGILGMQAGLLLFGWVISMLAAVMLVAIGLLLRAQRRHDKQAVQSVAVPATPAAPTALSGST